MTQIKNYVDHIEDELCGAKEYAEKFVWYKSKSNSSWANKYKEMAQDELKHATYLHDMAMAEIEELNKVFKPTQKMQNVWDESHTDYVEKTAWIKQMLAM